MNDSGLDHLLYEIGREIEYPPTPDLVFTVIHRLTRAPLSPRARRRPARLRPIVVGAALTLLLGTLGLIYSPTARRAAADLLGVVGIKIEFGGPADAPAPDQPKGALGLGETVSPIGLSDRVGFEVEVPRSGPVAGMASAVYLERTVGDNGMVSLVYPQQARTHEDVELLITQFEANVDEGFFKKLSATRGEVRFVEVRGTTGYWLSGRPHLFWYVDSNGAVREETVRLAGNVLVWEEGGITYRVEGPATLEEAVEIAESLG